MINPEEEEKMLLDILQKALDYNNVTIEQAKADSDWHEAYPLTKEQEDEWVGYSINKIMEFYKVSKKAAKKKFQLFYLAYCPARKKE